jgi:hypothetical protein
VAPFISRAQDLEIDPHKLGIQENVKAVEFETIVNN